ncbi:MAG: hypothetical protein P9L91_04495 [Candidatus Zophobacter franzmannii]|nr:hypothetical protein [Candidatus Zophobacter franzmannii]
MKRIIVLILALGMMFSLFATKKTIYRVKHFSEKGTRRLVERDQRKVYYYRSVRGQDLVIAKPSAGEYTLKTISKIQDNVIDVSMFINDIATPIKLVQVGFNDKYTFFKDYTFRLPEDVKELRIRTFNRNAYFRFFQKAVLTLSDDPMKVKPFTSEKKVEISNGKTGSEYYMATEANNITFAVDGEFDAYFFVRSAIVAVQKPAFDIYQNGELIRTESIDLKKSGKFTSDGYECISIGRRIDLITKTGENRFKIVPQNANPILIRVMKIRKRDK